ncbi:MAG: hypothetical protein ACXVB9_20965 [Bdellovibrionota bacterium]
MEDYPRESRAVAGSLWMLGLSVALFFLPVVSGIIAGLVGGFKVGTTRMAMTAAGGALIFTTVILWMLFSLMPIPLLGNLASQPEIALLIILTDLGLLIGAGVGGTIAENRIDRLNRA